MDDYRWRGEEVQPHPTASPLELARGCLLRAIGWSILAGVVLGIIYVVLGFILFVFPRFSVGMLLASADWLWGMMLFGFWQLTWQGASAGLVLGTANGLVLAVVALVGVVPRLPAQRYQRILGAVGTATTLLGFWVDGNCLASQTRR